MEATPRQVAAAAAIDAMAGANLGEDELFELALQSRVRGGEIMGPLLALLSPRAVIERLLERPTSDRVRDADLWALSRGVRPHLRPRLDPNQVDELGALALDFASSVSPNTAPLGLYVAAQLGQDDDLRSIVSGWRDRALARRGAPGWLDQLLAISEPATLAAEWSRLAVQPGSLTPAQLLRWLATTGEHGLWLVTQCVGALGKIEAQVMAATVAARLHQPVMAPEMLHMQPASKAAPVARRWLDEHPLACALGLAPLLGGSGEASTKALKELFESWLAGGAPPKDVWAMRTLGLLGGDRCALELARLVRGWPSQGQHAHAAAGLEVLTAIGSDTALLQIYEIGRRVRSKALRTRAQAAMRAIAKSRGLTEEGLLDRTVPDCGLDQRGTRLFTYGTRRFAFALEPSLRPMLHELDAEGRPTGAPRSNPPRPGARDDAAQAAAARRDWQDFKRQVTGTVEIQAERLARAMRLQRRWSPDDFNRLFVRHPLQVHLVRSLLWGAWVQVSGGGAAGRRDDSMRLTDAFRVTDELDLATADDRRYSIPATALVGLIHPLDLDAEARAAWAGVIEDYGLVPPFAQLTRPVHRLGPGEERATQLTRPGLSGIASGALMSILERRGWERVVEVGGLCRSYQRFLATPGVTAGLELRPGVRLGEPHTSGDQSIDCCWFVSGDPPSGPPLSLGAVDPVVVSETIVDLSILESKAHPPA